MSMIFGQRLTDSEKRSLEEWYKATNRKQITLVTAGRSGAGKSTLIGNMLQLKGDAAPIQRHDPSSVTTKVKLYTSTVNEIEVRIIDTPGLAATDVSEKEAMADLQFKTGGKADMLLYCISILPNSKIDEHDGAIIKKLTHVFGSSIWEHTILIFTFANLVKQIPGNSMPQLVKEYADKFQSVLRSVCSSFSVVSIFTCDQDKEQRPPATIIALPAGLILDEELVEGIKWDECIYLEALKKCNRDAIPALLKVRGPTPWIIRKALAIGQFIGTTGSTAAAGTIVGAVIGGAVGGAVGAMTGRSGAVVLGAQMGARIAAAATGGLGALAGGRAAHSTVTEYEKKQADLEQIQETLQRKFSLK